MNLFPFYEEISACRFLVIGGGRIAREKVEVLKQFTDRITVLAAETDLTEVPVVRKKFEAADLDLGDVVIAATSDRTLNRRISELCRTAGKKVNVVDDAELCTFFFPAIIRRGPLVASVSTCGASPAFARYVKMALNDSLPDNTEEILDTLAAAREWVPGVIGTQEERGRFYKAVLAEMLAGTSFTEEELHKKAERFSKESAKEAVTAL